MRSALARITTAAVALTMTGCGVQTGWMTLNPAPRPLSSRPADEVQMFTSARPTRPFVEHGLLTVATGTLGPGDLVQLAALREEAAKHGCDGVVVTSENKMASGGGPYSNVVERTYGFRAVCVVFTDTPAAAAAPPPAATPACKSHLDCKAPLVCPAGECVAPACTADATCGSGRGCSLEGQCEPIAPRKPEKR